MEPIKMILLAIVIICAVSVSLSKRILSSVVIFMAFSLVMSVIWILLESPDLAITEAAVGAGITSLLLFITIKKVESIDDAEEGNKHD